MHILVGLGNPGEEYKETRHNAGRMAAESFVRQNGFPDFKFDKKYQSLVSVGEVAGVGSKSEKTGKKNAKKNISEKVTVLLPETFMNKSGVALKSLITSAKKAEQLVVLQDDLDMPTGKIKLLFNRGSGGHKGVESIQRAIKTEAFTRIKIGIVPATSTGKLRKPDGEKLLDFIVGSFKKDELSDIKKASKKAAEAALMVIVEGREKAMGEFNGN